MMNLKEVDEVREWVRENWMTLGETGRKLLWSRVKRREEELLGRRLGKPLPAKGRVMDGNEAKGMDEYRRLRQVLRDQGINPDKALAES